MPKKKLYELCNLKKKILPSMGRSHSIGNTVKKKAHKEEIAQGRKQEKVHKKKKYLQRGCYADRASSYVHSFMARDEPHVSVGGLLAWERSTRKKFACKQRRCTARDSKKGRSRRKQMTSAGRMERHVTKERKAQEHAGENGWKATRAGHGRLRRWKPTTMNARGISYMQ